MKLCMSYRHSIAQHPDCCRLSCVLEAAQKTSHSNTIQSKIPLSDMGHYSECCMPRKASTCSLLSGCVCVCVIPPVSACCTSQGPTDRGGAGRGVGRQPCGSMYTQPKTGVQGCKCSITMSLTEYQKQRGSKCIQCNWQT